MRSLPSLGAYTRRLACLRLHLSLWNPHFHTPGDSRFVTPLFDTHSALPGLGRAFLWVVTSVSILAPASYLPPSKKVRDLELSTCPEGRHWCLAVLPLFFGHRQTGTPLLHCLRYTPAADCAKRLNPKAQTPVSQKPSNPADLQLFSCQHEKESKVQNKWLNHLSS